MHACAHISETLFSYVTETSSSFEKLRDLAVRISKHSKHAAILGMNMH